jgi:hypothetical protein
MRKGEKIATLHGSHPHIYLVSTMCGSRTGGWSLPGVMSDLQRCVD